MARRGRLKASSAKSPLRVGLFVTCLVDLFRPSVGFSALRLLEEAGCEVIVPEAQTCCGQPAWNSGDPESARKVAKVFLEAFDNCEYIVVPSGSCAGMLAHHLPQLFKGSSDEKKAQNIAAKTHELTAFLADILKVKKLSGRYKGKVAYHDSCSSLREMKVKTQPRKLLALTGAKVLDLTHADTCCGFGGTFAIKYGDISASMAEDKASDVLAQKPDMLTSGDMGCLLNIAGRLSRRGSALPVRHIAEILAGNTEALPIGSGEEK